MRATDEVASAGAERRGRARPCGGRGAGRRQRVEARELPREAIDPALVRQRLRRVAQARGGELPRSVRALAELALPAAHWRTITEQLLERGALTKFFESKPTATAGSLRARHG